MKKIDIDNSSELIGHICDALQEGNNTKRLFPEHGRDLSNQSAVLLLLGEKSGRNGQAVETCLILNKRSRKVRQPGDLCCPGGGVSPRLDLAIAKALNIPFSPLVRWPHWKKWRNKKPDEAKQMAALFATSLRESFEEMRLNPIYVRFLGPMAPLGLAVTDKMIYPMVGWVAGQKRFVPNWEVEKIVRIPFKDLLDPSCYGRYRIQIMPKHENHADESPAIKKSLKIMTSDFPCFVYRNKDGQEVLWGATYRMVRRFLDIVFGFKPPEMDNLPVTLGVLDENYFTGDKH